MEKSNRLNVDSSAIFPQSCPRCHDDIMNFYSNFLSNSDQKYRKHQINSLISNKKCDCYEKVLKKCIFQYIIQV